MAIVIDRGHGADEDVALAELIRDGFTASAVDYEPGRTEPHQHGYDIGLHIVEGEFKLADVALGIVHSCGPGTRIFVGSGTPHYEDHGVLRMVVGRRHPS